MRAMSALLLCALVSLFSAPVLRAQGRGPSTPEERAQLVKLAKASEVDLMEGTTQEDRGWFIKFMADVPDISLDIGPVAMWGTEAFAKEQQPLALYQFMLSATAFQIEHPDKAKDPLAVDQAGLEGVLRAYEKCVKKAPSLRSKNLDEAISNREKGALADFVKTLRSKK